MKLESKIAVITGGASGIGAACAKAFAQSGAQVAIVDVNLEGATSVAKTVEGIAIHCDLADASAIDAMVQTVESQLGPIDLLFNNAGIGAPPVPIEELPVSSWLEVVGVNLTATWLCSRAAFRQMKNQSPTGGRIINNGSVSAQTPRPFSSPYTATKHAITGLTKALSLEGRDCGITVGQIDIGNALTPLTNQISEGALQADGTVRGESTMDVEHVAEAIVLLAELPQDVNVPQMTIMANDMPLMGRG